MAFRCNRVLRKKKLKVAKVDYNNALPVRQRQNKKRRDQGNTVDVGKPNVPDDNTIISERVS